jgi:hypothetical protein
VGLFVAGGLSIISNMGAARRLDPTLVWVGFIKNAQKSRNQAEFGDLRTIKMPAKAFAGAGKERE